MSLSITIVVAPLTFLSCVSNCEKFSTLTSFEFSIEAVKFSVAKRIASCGFVSPAALIVSWLLIFALEREALSSSTFEPIVSSLLNPKLVSFTTVLFLLISTVKSLLTYPLLKATEYTPVSSNTFSLLLASWLKAKFLKIKAPLLFAVTKFPSLTTGIVIVACSPLVNVKLYNPPFGLTWLTLANWSSLTFNLLTSTKLSTLLTFDNLTTSSLVNTWSLAILKPLASKLFCSITNLVGTTFSSAKMLPNGNIPNARMKSEK